MSIALGNLLSVYARNKFPAHYALKCIKLSGLYVDLMGDFRSRGLDRSDLIKYIEESLIQRCLAIKDSLIDDRKNQNGIIMKYRDSEDNIITMLAFLAVVSLFVLWLFRDVNELFNGGVELYSYSVNLAIGVIVSYIFFYLNFMIPKKKKLRNTLVYVGECIGTICFNEISRVRVFEPGFENLKIMNIMGVKYQNKSINPDEIISIQEDINKENVLILDNIFKIIDKNAFQSRTALVELLNTLFPFILENERLMKYNRGAEHKIDSFITNLSCKRYSGKSNVGLVSKAAIGRLNYLLENESNMHSIKTAIQFGKSDM